MTWVRFDDIFPLHRKVDSLTDPAFRLHVSVIFWCARNLTDGCVPEEDLGSSAPRTMQRPEKFVPELVRRGLWEKTEDGWLVHDYLDFQPSKAKVLDERKKNAERQKRFRDNGKATHDSNGSSNGVTNAASNGTPVPARPEEDSLRSSSSPPRRNDPPRPDVDELCEQLRARIVANGAKASVTAKWRADARLLLDRDGRDLDQTKRLIDWATSHSFWAANVLSMAKFRAKYDQLLLQAKREFQQQRQPVRSQTDSNIEKFMQAGSLTGPRALELTGGDQE